MTGIGEAVGIGVGNSFERHFVVDIQGLQLPNSQMNTVVAAHGYAPQNVSQNYSQPQYQQTPQYPSQISPQNDYKTWILALGVGALVTLAGVGIMLLLNRKDSPQPIAQTTPAATVTPSPVTTPSVTAVPTPIAAAPTAAAPAAAPIAPASVPSSTTTTYSTTQNTEIGRASCRERV